MERYSSNTHRKLGLATLGVSKQDISREIYAPGNPQRHLGAIWHIPHELDFHCNRDSARQKIFRSK